MIMIFGALSYRATSVWHQCSMEVALDEVTSSRPSAAQPHAFLAASLHSLVNLDLRQDVALAALVSPLLMLGQGRPTALTGEQFPPPFLKWVNQQ